MSAARYVGRVGGLAIAFGVGTAVLTGYGIASADTTSGGESNSSQGSATSGSSTGASLASDSQDSTAAGSAYSVSDSDDVDVSGDADDSSADSAEDDSVTLDGSGALDEADVDERDAVDDVASSDAEDLAGNETAAEDRSQALAWLSSPEVMAGRAPAPVAVSVPTPGLDVINGASEALSGDEPTTPPAGAPLDLAMAAAARRANLTGIHGNPITVDPVLGFSNGVIQGDLNASPDPLTLNYVVTRKPDLGGKVHLNELTDPETGKKHKDGTFSFLPDLSVLDTGGAEQFTVMVSEYSSLVKLLAQLPLLGAIVEPIVLRLQQMPLIGGLLQPLIGYRVFEQIDVNVGELVPEDAPAAFTTYVTSFDGVQISTNFFPATGLAEGEKARTILNGPGLGAAGNTNTRSVMTTYDLVPGLVPLRDAGYNVVTWDPRGEHASGGIMQLDNPFFEGRDTKHIIDWVATRPETMLDAPGDPVMGMVGGSYGGGIQLVTAGIDDRIEAIVPVIAWNSLNEALYPTKAFKTAAGDLLGTVLRVTGARVNSQIYPAIFLGSLFGFITESQQATIASSGPTVLVNNITAPTLLIQGTVDILFDLAQASTNAQMVQDNGIDVEMLWVCGGHGVCLTEEDPLQTERVKTTTMNWLDKYVNGNELVPTGPVFGWYDQNGTYHSSELLPTDEGFHGPSIGAESDGGFLPIFPVLGGSRSLNASEARVAVNLEVPQVENTTQLVGAPELTIHYSGLGTSRHVFAQLVDNNTGVVLGNAVTPIPVTLDGRTRQVTVSMEQIAYTIEPGDNVTLQVFGSATQFANLGTWGWIDVDHITLGLRTVADNQGALAQSAQRAVSAA